MERYKMNRKLQYLIILFMITITGNTQAGIITFGDGAAINANGYTEDGMIISKPDNYQRIRDWTTYSSTAPGEREFLFNGLDNLTTFALVSGAIFDLTSMFIDSVNNASNSGIFNVIADNGASVALQTSGVAGGTYTYSFGSAFNNITSFTIGCTGCQGVVDDIVFDGTIPEPAPIALLSLGLIAIGWTRRKAA